MPKKGIYATNNNQVFSKNKNAEAIFKLFLDNKEGLTQTFVAKQLGVSQSTISKFIKDHSAPFDYGKKSYFFDQEDGLFKLLESEPAVSGLSPYASDKQKKEFIKKFNKAISNLSEKNAFSGEKAKKFTDIIVVYTIREDCNKDIVKELNNLYGKSIYHTSVHKNKMIIIVQKNYFWLQNIVNSICNLYNEVIKLSK